MLGYNAVMISRNYVVSEIQKLRRTTYATRENRSLASFSGRQITMLVERELAVAEADIRPLLTLEQGVAALLLDRIEGGKYLICLMIVQSLRTNSHQHYGRSSLRTGMTLCHFTGRPGS